MRFMVDVTHDNLMAAQLDFKPEWLVALYCTGSPDIKATDNDVKSMRAIHPAVISIDQGFTGSPVPLADVRDVEKGAWMPDHAVANKPWNPPRPTIYCNRSTLNQVIAAGWSGDVWLAEWGQMPTSAPHIPGVNIVAVQYGNVGIYDISVIFDNLWPFYSNNQAPVLSVTPYPEMARFGWGQSKNPDMEYELEIKGAGGPGTGTSYSDKIYATNHAQVNLAPGHYVARVRDHTCTAVGEWSAWKRFQVH